MIETVLTIDGMACAMCESHVNDTVRSTCPVKKVTSSHTKGETVILSEQPLDEAALRAAIDATGYRVLTMTAHPYEKKGMFAFLKKYPHLSPGEWPLYVQPRIKRAVSHILPKTVRQTF